MLDELGRVTRCGRRAPASGVAAHSHIAQFCSFPPRPSYHVSSPPGRPRAPPRRSLSRSTPTICLTPLPHSSPSCINALELDYKFTCKFTCKFKLTAAFQIPESARRHKSSSYPPLRPPPPHQALSRSPASTTLKKKQRHHYLPQHATGPEYCTEARGGTVKYCN